MLRSIRLSGYHLVVVGGLICGIRLIVLGGLGWGRKVGEFRPGCGKTRGNIRVFF